MTVILGFTTSDGVILASDSQYTFQGGKFPSGEKIVRLESPDGRCVLLAKAGRVLTADRFHEAFETQLADGVTDIRKAAESAMRSVRECASLDLHKSLPTEHEREQHFGNMDCSALIAYMDGSAPRLYSIELRGSLTTAPKQLFECDGSGSDIARQALHGFNLPELSADVAVGVAAYAIQEAKEFGHGCGGRTQLGIVAKGLCYVAPEPISERLEKAAKAVIMTARKDFPKHVLKGMKLARLDLRKENQKHAKEASTR